MMRRTYTLVPEFAPDTSKAISIHLLEDCQFGAWINSQPGQVANWAAANGFSAQPGEVLPVPGENGDIGMVVAGWRSIKNNVAGQFPLSAILGKLPAGDYRFAEDLPPADADSVAMFSLLGQYKFDLYRDKSKRRVRLIPPNSVCAEKMLAIASGDFLARDLINTPANNLGPADLANYIEDLADSWKATVKSEYGEDVAVEYPMLFAVGQSTDDGSRMIDLRWGRKSDPKITLVGKGICFDTGGLNIKTGNSMALMKKDMAGAAVALGIAHSIITLELPVRLRVLVPAAENLIAKNAFRPGDVLGTAHGRTVEVTNTDAEGRLVLADALTLACRERPDLLISIATLTGAARVALGPEITPFFTDDDAIAEIIQASASRTRDPVWRLPFWQPYEEMLRSEVADLKNSAEKPFAGAIVAALFLRKFVDRSTRYAHFDIFGWQPDEKHGIEKGGATQSLRTIVEAIPKVFGL